MGRVRCTQHGLHGGPHTCRHLSDEIYSVAGGKEVTERLSITSFTVDPLGDGDMALKYLCCEVCATSFRVEEGVVVTIEFVEENPPMSSWAPTCSRCVDEWVRTAP